MLYPIKSPILSPVVTPILSPLAYPILTLVVKTNHMRILFTDGTDADIDTLKDICCALFAVLCRHHGTDIPAWKCLTLVKVN